MLEHPLEHVSGSCSIGQDHFVLGKILLTIPLSIQEDKWLAASLYRSTCKKMLDKEGRITSNDIHVS